LNKELADLNDKRIALKAKWQSEKEAIEGVQKVKALLKIINKKL
jgi:ATP-dependent Clp protease ATP-binding subunit ClpB